METQTELMHTIKSIIYKKNNARAIPKPTIIILAKNVSRQQRGIFDKIYI
jgi:hypothetical protein